MTELKTVTVCTLVRAYVTCNCIVRASFNRPETGENRRDIFNKPVRLRNKLNQFLSLSRPCLPDLLLIFCILSMFAEIRGRQQFITRAAGKWRTFISRIIEYVYRYEY